MILVFLIHLGANFQSSHKVSGILLNTKGEAVIYANVLLLHHIDSMLIKGTVSGKDGSYKLENIHGGKYRIMCTMVGFQPVYSSVFEIDGDYRVENLILNEGELLDEVMVAANKPLYQQKVDRMVINVANSIVSAGGSALEILERSPGIIVERHNNSISIVGKSGVEVMINGKTSYLPTTAIVQLLEGMNAENIEFIELITTPPSTEDAEGNAGFINIIMKEESVIGLNGSYAFSYGYGKNGALFSNNVNFNFRKDRFNMFGNYAFSNRLADQLFTFHQTREVDADLLSKATLSHREPSMPRHNIRVGVDYDFTDKTVMGVLLNGYDSRWAMDALTMINLSKNGQPVSSAELLLDEVNHWKHMGVNLNLRHNYSKSKYISFDADYLFYKDDNPINYANSYFDKNEVFTYDELARSTKLTPIKTWVSRFDYSNQVDEKMKIETGVKGAFSTFDNDASVANLINNVWEIDHTLTSKSDLAENIYAAYFAMEYVINDHWSSKVGLRYEYTDSQLDTETEGNIVDRQYGKIFPTIFLNRKFSDELNMNLSYAKRITRPTFSQMAPYVIMWDPDTFTLGNIEIQPAFSNSIKYDINYKSSIFSLVYSLEDSSIVRFQITYDTINDRIILRSENLDFTKIFSATFGTPLKISDWWRTQNNITYTKSSIRAFNSPNDTFNLSSGSLRANSTSSFKFSNNLTFDIVGSYQGPRFSGTSKIEDTFRMDIGLHKDFGDRWGSLKFGIIDLFDSYDYNSVTDIPEEKLQIIRNFRYSYRSFRLTYARNFGNSKVKSSRVRETGSEEERKRIN